MLTGNEAYHRARLASEKIRDDAYRVADQALGPGAHAWLVHRTRGEASMTISFGWRIALERSIVRRVSG